MGTTAILWSLATIGALAGLFAGLIRLSRMLPVRRPIRILGAIALWFVASTATCWLLFARTDAAAGSTRPPTGPRYCPPLTSCA